MQQQTRSMSGEVFDYGCGGAPYRNLFKHCRVISRPMSHRAAGGSFIESNRRTDEPSESFDGVVSTQVWNM